MLRMTPLASAIVALLLGIEAYAAEETFDTHFMIGGMKGFFSCISFNDRWNERPAGCKYSS